MTDRPIIFSAPMVQALLAGRKTQTRRLAWREKECPGGAVNDGGGQMDYIEPSFVRSPSPWRMVQPGDRLWVREAWCQQSDDGAMVAGRAHYRADGNHVALSDGDGFAVTTAAGREASPWRPSIHMPRWASRLTLTVTDVRAQRLQEITEEDARAEGARAAYGEPFATDSGLTDRRRFQLLWDTLHGPGAWDANPEVVALTFTVAQRNIDA